MDTGFSGFWVKTESNSIPRTREFSIRCFFYHGAFYPGVGNRGRGIMAQDGQLTGNWGPFKGKFFKFNFFFLNELLYKCCGIRHGGMLAWYCRYLTEVVHGTYSQYDNCDVAAVPFRLAY